MDNIMNEPQAPSQDAVANTIPPTKARFKRHKIKRAPTMFDDARDAAAGGDLTRLLAELTDNRGCFSAELKCDLIEQALHSLKRRGGTGLMVKRMLDEILLLDGQLLANVHLEVRARIENGGRMCREVSRTAAATVPPEMLDRMTRIEERYMAVARTVASILHTFTLANVPVEIPRRRRSRKIVRFDTAVRKGVRRVAIDR